MPCQDKGRQERRLHHRQCLCGDQQAMPVCAIGYDSDFEWQTSERLSELAGSKKLDFDIRSLAPDKFSFPYHYHRNAEELFYIISGECSMRTPDSITRVHAGDLIHFASGAEGAHQLFNDTAEPCIYLDIRTFDGIDIVD